MRYTKFRRVTVKVTCHVAHARPLLLPMAGGGAASPHLLPRVRLPSPARDALVGFLFDDAADDPLLEHGDTWCAWDGGPPAPAEGTGGGGGGGGGNGSDVAAARGRVTIALAPGATHIAAARGQRLAVVATVPIAERTSSSSTASASDLTARHNDANDGQLCSAEVLDAAAGQRVNASSHSCGHSCSSYGVVPGITQVLKSSPRGTEKMLHLHLKSFVHPK